MHYVSTVLQICTCALWITNIHIPLFCTHLVPTSDCMYTYASIIPSEVYYMYVHLYVNSYIKYDVNVVSLQLSFICVLCL